MFLLSVTDTGLDRSLLDSTSTIIISDAQAEE
jgi:hypothetical protein